MGTVPKKVNTSGRVRERQKPKRHLRRGKRKTRTTATGTLRGADGKPIAPVRIVKGRPVYSLKDVARMEAPYSNEPNWE